MSTAFIYIVFLSLLKSYLYAKTFFSLWVVIYALMSHVYDAMRCHFDAELPPYTPFPLSHLAFYATGIINYASPLRAATRPSPLALRPYPRLPCPSACKLGNLFAPETQHKSN